MKQMVLNIHERQEEEDYQGMTPDLPFCFIHTLDPLLVYIIRVVYIKFAFLTSDKYSPHVMGVISSPPLHVVTA